MSCRLADDNRQDYLDNDLSESARVEFETHLRACDECRAWLADARSLSSLLKQQATSVPEPGAAYWEQSSQLLFARTIEHGPTQTNRESSKRSLVPLASYRRLAGAAATFAASVILFLSAVWLGTSYQQARLQVIQLHPSVSPIQPVFNLLLSRNEAEPILSTHETAVLGQGMLMIGSPGMLSRSEALPYLLAVR